MAADSDVTTMTLTGDPIVEEATKRFRRCAEWESTARENFLNDYKFRHGDSYNGYQWPDQVRLNRDLDARPCLTMNVVRQHNLQITNEALQNKSSVMFRPVGGQATKDSADLISAMFRRVEYCSDAQSAYKTACGYQVDGGIGWIRLVTEYENGRTFNQDLRIKRVWDPLSVYMDMDCQEENCSDAKYAFVFDLVPDEELEEAYPRVAKLLETVQPLGAGTQEDSWNVKDHTRVCEYFRKVPKYDRLISFVDPDSRQRKEILKSQLPPEIEAEIMALPLTKWRETEEWEVQWFLIVGQRVVDRTVWPGKYIPLIKVVGEETVIEGVLDRKGHTRAMLDAQRMYNYNSPLALSTPVPTPIGWTTMGEIQAGDEVLDEHGKPIRVLGTSPVFDGRTCYKITFSNGSSIVADAGHQWTVEERGKRKAKTWDWKGKTVTTAELVSGKHFICSNAPLELEEDKELPIHPYLFGVWLGDGHTANTRISSHMDDIEEMRALISSLGYSVGEARRDANSNGGSFTVLGVRHKFTTAGFLGDKWIPLQYLRASAAQRLALLQGLMDTDGHITPTQQCVFINTNQEIITGFVELLRTFGINPSIQRNHGTRRLFPSGKEYNTQDSFRVSFTADPDDQIFRLSRKRTVQQKQHRVHWRRTKRVGICSVEAVASVPVKCIGVDSESHLFLAGWGMVPTHNSSQVEFVALQGKTPWVAAAKAIEEYESMWNTANVVNHSVLIYNHVPDDGSDTPVPPPIKTPPPSASPAYESGMATAFNQMMMTSGQWQNQMGMGGNERTGEAISRRQEQGYTAVYHFQDNYAAALRYIGKQYLDLYPKLYDTRRLMQLKMEDGEEFQLELDPTARQELQQTLDADQRVVRRVLNPKLGQYDVEADVGPAYGTRREETVKAMTLLLTQSKELVPLIGDLLLNAMDFKEATEAAQRLKRMVPAQALGKGPTQMEAHLQQQVAQLSGLLAKALQQTGKDKLKLAGKDELRDIEVYDAETKRMAALAKQLPQDPEGLASLIHQLVSDSLESHLTPVIQGNEKEAAGGDLSGPQPGQLPPTPPLPGARQAPDGEWYISDPTRKGKYLKVAPRAGVGARAGR